MTRAAGSEYRNSLIVLALLWSPFFILAPGLLPIFVNACTLVILAISAVWFLGRQWRRGATALLVGMLCVAVYGVVLVGVPLANGPKLHELGETVGSDSFAGTVEVVDKKTTSAAVSYDLMVQVTNLTRQTTRAVLREVWRLLT